MNFYTTFLLSFLCIVSSRVSSPPQAKPKIFNFSPKKFLPNQKKESPPPTATLFSHIGNFYQTDKCIGAFKTIFQVTDSHKSYSSIFLSVLLSCRAYGPVYFPSSSKI